MEKIMNERNRYEKYGITFNTFYEGLVEIKEGDENAFLMLGCEENVIEDAQRCGYYLINE